MILCESVKQTSQIYDLMMVAYSVGTQRPKGVEFPLKEKPKVLP